MRLARRLTFLVIAGVLAACAAAGSSHPIQHNVVTAAELAPMANVSVYDALSRIRPAFLRSHDVATVDHPNPEPVHVYLNGSRMEGFDVLRQVQADRVQEIRFYEPQDANTRFGTGNNGGVIDVTLKR